MPFADTSVYKVPEGAVATSRCSSSPTSCPTAFEVGVLNGGVEPGDTVAIVGAGPIGLAADHDREALHARAHRRDRPRPTRLEQAREFGADVMINNSREDAVAAVMEMTDGLGADVAIEAVGIPLDVRALHRARPPRRTRRERRRARPLGDAASRDAVDP